MARLRLSLTRSARGLGHPEARRLIMRAAAQTLAAEGITEPCTLSVLLTDGEGIRELNRDFRGIDSETDVLSFPANELVPGAFEPDSCEREPETGGIVLGDMAVNLSRCEAQGMEYGNGFERELQYLSVHSVLHLLGYDHVDEAEQKRQMRQREKLVMARLAELDERRGAV